MKGEYSVVDNINADEGGPFSGSKDLDQFGFVGGGGAEWAIPDKVSFRVDGLYYVFGEDLGDSASLENIFVARRVMSYPLPTAPGD